MVVRAAMTAIPWLYISRESPHTTEGILLRREDADHVRKVLRLRKGALVVAVDAERGLAYNAQLEGSSQGICVSLGQEIKSQPASPPVRTLCQALLKGKKSDLVVEKAVELGVQEVFFFEAERSVVRLKSTRDRASKEARLSEVGRGAASQSKKFTLPSVRVFGSIQAMLSEGAPSSVYICSLRPEAIPLWQCVKPGNDAIGIIVGPEGDFTAAEYEQFLSQGAKPVSLGPHVLRAETAAMASIAMVLALASREETSA